MKYTIKDKLVFAVIFATVVLPVYSAVINKGVLKEPTPKPAPSVALVEPVAIVKQSPVAPVKQSPVAPVKAIKNKDDIFTRQEETIKLYDACDHKLDSKPYVKCLRQADQVHGNPFESNEFNYRDSYLSHECDKIEEYVLFKSCKARQTETLRREFPSEY